MPVPKIITTYEPKPIPISAFDWTAVTEHYDLGSPVGWGATEQEAIDDLCKQIED
jgi:hypothetical protein